MRRVVFFAPGLAEPGGAARRARLLTAGLAARGWEVRVVTRAGTLSRFALRRSKGLTVLEVPGFGRRRLGALLFLMFAVPLGLWWGARTSVYVAIQLASQSTAASLCSLIMRRPFISFVTSSGLVSEIDYVLSGPLTKLRRLLVGRARYIVAQTPATARELAPLVPAERVALLPTPVEPVDAPPLNGAPRAVFSGRLSREKDLPRLLDVWREVASDRPEARLVLVGEGGDYRSVERELRQKVDRDDVLRQTVSFTGWVDDIDPYLRSADIYVFPSLSEGMSNALVEACAYGRVVVASDIEANRAVVGDDYPLLFSAGDGESLSTRLRSALDDEQLRNEAVQKVVARMRSFSVDEVITRLERMMEDAADSPRH